MSKIVVEASDVIPAPAEKIYAVLADYHEGHPSILPQPYFRELVVEEGGRGAGTVIGIRMEVLGVEQRYHLHVSEPEPGRVLMERDPDLDLTTTFTVAPLNGGSRSLVTIATESRPSPGLRGLLERLVNPAVTRRIYQEELKNLADYLAR
jgi:hypothetical protein